MKKMTKNRFTQYGKVCPIKRKKILNSELNEKRALKANILCFLN